MTAMQWLFFASGWIAWTVDAIDFFSVSLSNHRLSEYFDKPLKTITTSITLTLLVRLPAPVASRSPQRPRLTLSLQFRPVGAIIFGLLSDRYGRKWPLIADLLVCGVLSLGTAFVKTFSQFLAVRSLFGIAMGVRTVRCLLPEPALTATPL